MTSEDVRRFCKAQPFVPFVIRLIDGRTFTIPHRDFVWTLDKSLRAVGVSLKEGEEMAINTTLILSIEWVTPNPQPVENAT